MKTVEEKLYFANRLDATKSVEDSMRDAQIQKVWFTDRPWQKDTPVRYEVIRVWEED